MGFFCTFIQNPTMTKHELHIPERAYHLINIGDQNFLLVPDGKYKVGDRLALYQKNDKGTFTGNALECKIDTITRKSIHLKEGACVIGIRSMAYEVNVN